MLTSAGVVEIDAAPVPSLPDWFNTWLDDQPRAPVESPTPVETVAPTTAAEPLKKMPQEASSYAGPWTRTGTASKTGSTVRELEPTGVEGRRLMVNIPTTAHERNLIILTPDLLFDATELSFFRRQGSVAPSSAEPPPSAWKE